MVPPLEKAHRCATKSAEAILASAAEAIVESLVNGTGIGDAAVGPFPLLHSLLLAENRCNSDAAEARSTALRCSFVAAMRAAALSAAATFLLVGGNGGDVPRVRVEVRHSAGRNAIEKVFTVGRAPECDIQVFGDYTVSRLQLLVVSMAGGMVVVDAWSSGGTRVVQRSDAAQPLPSSTPSNRCAFFFPFGERAFLLVGAHTTISLGHAETDAIPATRPSENSSLQDQLKKTWTRVGNEASSTGVTTGTVRCTRVWRRCFVIVQAIVRMHRAARERERLLYRCRAARRAEIISPTQYEDLKERLVPAHRGSIDEVGGILDGLGAPLALDSRVHPGSGMAWVCMICCEQHCTRGWICPCQHRFCRDCVVRWVETQALPKCPAEGCCYHLEEHDLNDLRVPAERIQAWHAARLEDGLVSLQNNDESQLTLFRCPNGECSAAVVLGATEARTKYVCPCGAPPVCTGCGNAPYHYHVPCDSVQTIRARWLAWLQGGRDAYKGMQRRVVREANAQQRAIREALQRHSELERDEEWKAKNCRQCPKCRCIVSKIDGCNTMVCGQNTHGGNRQPGCGHRFSWISAKAYKPRVRSAKLPCVAKPLVAQANGLSARGVRHLFTQCALCNRKGLNIVGPRFRCIHCPSFSCCLKCEERLASEHDPSHVFQIMFEDDVEWGTLGVDLPRGSHARIRQYSGRRDDAAVLGLREDNGEGARATRKRHGQCGDAWIEGVIRGKKRGKYLLELAGGMRKRHVAIEELQPLLTQTQAEKLLATIPFHAGE